MTEAPAEAANRRPSPPRLAFRLALVLSLGAGAILVAAGIWNLASQRRQLTRLVEGQATTVIEMIRGATRDSMLRNDSAELSRLVTGLATRDEVDRLRVFDKQGRINYSSEPIEIGSRVDLDAEQCVACHAPDRPLSSPAGEGRTRIFERPGEGRFLALVAPIKNEAACSTAACHAHSQSQTVLGVLDVQLPLARVDAALAASQRQLVTGLVGTVAAVVLLALLLAWALRAAPGERADRRRATARRGRLHGARARGEHRRDRRPRARLEPDGRRAGRRARGARGMEPHSRGEGRREDARARGHPPAPAARREDDLARQARRERGARAQQPAGRDRHLRPCCSGAGARRPRRRARRSLPATTTRAS